MRNPFSVALTVALLLGAGGIAHARSHAAGASRELAAALAAMGGRGVVASVHALRLEAVGHRNMLEQSLRPEGHGGRTTLGFFQGRWSCQGEFPASGRTIASAERFAPELLGHWLMMRHADQPPFAFEAVEMWRYDAAGKGFENYIFDNASGIRRYTSPGWDGPRSTWTLASNGQPPDRFDAIHYAVDYSRSTGKQAWTTVDTLHCERRAP